MFDRHDEEMRDKVWKRSTILSTVLIVVVASYLLIKLFAGNPMQGSWSDTDGRYLLRVENGGKGKVELLGLTEEDAPLQLKMDYDLEREDKCITIHVSEEEKAKALEDCGEKITLQELDSELRAITGGFDFSIDQSELTLSEREYGEQLFFEKQ